MYRILAWGFLSSGIVLLSQAVASDNQLLKTLYIFAGIVLVNLGLAIHKKEIIEEINSQTE